VIELKEMVGRTQVKVSDDTGVITVIEGERSHLLEENEYYKFIVAVKKDK